MSGIVVEENIAAAALVFSIISFAISIWRAKYQEKISEKPILVFVYDLKKGWFIINIGNGPALNVIFALKKGGIYPNNSRWLGQTRLPPFSVGGEFALDWTDHDNVHGFGACYEDIRQRKYHTLCGSDQNHVRRGSETQLLEGHSVPFWWRRKAFERANAERDGM